MDGLIHTAVYLNIFTVSAFLGLVILAAIISSCSTDKCNNAANYDDQSLTVGLLPGSDGNLSAIPMEQKHTDTTKNTTTAYHSLPSEEINEEDGLSYGT